MIKKFRFLSKCFGFIGAFALILGFVSFKNVNAQNVNNTPSDLSDYDDSTYFNNVSNRPYWSNTNRSDLSSFDFNFNCYYSEEFQNYEMVNIPFDNNFTYYFTIFHKEINSSYSYRLNFEYTLFLSDYDYSEIDSSEYDGYIDITYTAGSTDLVLDYVLTINNENLINYFKEFGNNSIGLSIRNIKVTIKGVSSNFDISYIEVGCLPSYYYDIAQSYSSANYNNIFNNGFIEGYANAINNVKNTDYNGLTYNEILQNGYNQGYNAGASSVNETNVVIGGLFGSIANVPLTILNGLFPATILGVPIITVLLTFLGILVIIWLIKRLV